MHINTLLLNSIPQVLSVFFLFLFQTYPFYLKILKPNIDISPPVLNFGYVEPQKSETRSILLQSRNGKYLILTKNKYVLPM